MQAKTIILTDGGNLMACDPVNNTADKLQAISVFSDQAYTNDLPAGTNLAGIVGLAGGSFSASTRSLTTLPVNPLPADELSNLLLLKAPDRVVRHRLTITVQLANGKQFTTISEPVVIKP